MKMEILCKQKSKREKKRGIDMKIILGIVEENSTGWILVLEKK
jgi:hypothetical protein